MPTLNPQEKDASHVGTLTRFMLRVLRLPVLALTYVYLLRFPLLTAGALLLLPLSAFSKEVVTFLTRLGLTQTAELAGTFGADALLRGLFDISRAPRRLFLVSLAAFMVSWMALISYRLVSLYGKERFQVRRQGIELPFAPEELQWYHRALFTLLALPLVAGVVAQSSHDRAGLCWNVVAAVAGWLASLVVLALAILLPQALFVTAAHERPRPHALIEHWLEGPIVWFGRTLRRQFFRLRYLRWAHRLRVPLPALIALTPPYWGDGILEYVGDGEARRAVGLKPGHGIALWLGLWGVIFYGAVGVYVQFSRRGMAEIPPLLYVLLLLASLCWLLSTLAFFLDCYRVPILFPLLLWLAVTSALPWSDFYFPVLPPPAADAQTAVGATPAVTPRPAAPERDDESIIVVAANGGGIQSAAWAARVLTGLEQKCRDEMGEGCRFGSSIRLVSSVSGGSVGAMYFVNEYVDGKLPDEKGLKGIVRRAAGSSLGAAAWGLAYPDFLRLLVPLPIFNNDRGRALEKAWLRYEDEGWDEARRNNLRRGLADWKRDTMEGRRPGIILNATNGDSGARLPFTTVELPPGSYGRAASTSLFAAVRDGRQPDIPVVTAARLSASFPYVSPAARADLSAFGVEGGAHIVDGGYYDNYGISSLVEWLDAELRNNLRIKRVLILQIRGASSYATGVYRGGTICPVGFIYNDAAGEKSKRGWLYQAFAPLSTLLKVRDTGQLMRNDVEINLLRDKWRDSKSRVVDIYTTVFEFKGADPPLSWHLTADQKEAIEANWLAEMGGCNDPESHPDTDTDKRNVKYGGWPTVRTFLTLGREEPQQSAPLFANFSQRLQRAVSRGESPRAGEGTLENLMRQAR